MADKAVRLDIPDPDYARIDTARDGVPAIVVVNRALVGFAPTTIFAWHLFVRLEADDCVENGMPTRAEGEALTALDETIERTVFGAATEHGAVNALFLARVTGNKRRELHYYVHDPEIAHNALQPLIKDPAQARVWEYQMEHDGGWTHAAPFFDLCLGARDARGGG